MNCTKCEQPMKRRENFAGVDFFGCKSWRKCGRHGIDGKTISDAEWNERIAAEAKDEQAQTNRIRANHMERDRLQRESLMAIILQHGEKKKWNMKSKKDPHGEDYAVELRIKKEDIEQISKLCEPSLHFQQDGEEMVVTLVNTYALYCDKKYQDEEYKN